MVPFHMSQLICNYVAVNSINLMTMIEANITIVAQNQIKFESVIINSIVHLLTVRHTLG